MSRFADRTATALLVIDLQVGVLRRAHRADDVVARVAGLVGRVRQAGVPVVWVRHSDAELVPGSDAWQLVDELVPVEGEPVVDNTFRSAFAETTLDAILAELQVGALVVCGAQSEFCVASTIAAALERGFDVSLVHDAHTTENAEFEGLDLPAEVTIGLVNAMFATASAPQAECGVLAAGDVHFEPARNDDAELLAMVEAEDDADEDRADAQVGLA